MPDTPIHSILAQNAAPSAPRSAIVDLGSNSVRLVVFEGLGRNPVAIFNEKAVLRLGRGLQTTGRLNEAGVVLALRVMARYNAIARAMGADPFEVLATAAVRDASNGAEFVGSLQARMPGVPIRVLSGQEEAALSCAGVLCGIPARTASWPTSAAGRWSWCGSRGAGSATPPAWAWA